MRMFLLYDERTKKYIPLLIDKYGNLYDQMHSFDTKAKAQAWMNRNNPVRIKKSL